MKAKLAKLIDVKSIVTLLLTIVFCVMALCGTISGADFLTIFTVVMAFYFGTQAQKKADTTNGHTGPQQAVPVAGSTEPVMYTATDPATANDVHPPDEDVTAKVGFEY